MQTNRYNELMEDMEFESDRGIFPGPTGMAQLRWGQGTVITSVVLNGMWLLIHAFNFNGGSLLKCRYSLTVDEWLNHIIL